MEIHYKSFFQLCDCLSAFGNWLKMFVRGSAQPIRYKTHDQPRLGHPRFPAIGTGHVYLLEYAHWLIEIALFLVLRYVIENRSNRYYFSNESCYNKLAV